MRLIDIPAATRLTFVCEKVSQARNFASAWHAERPDTQPLFVALNSLRGGRTVLPRNIPYRDLPVIQEPVWAKLETPPRVMGIDPDPRRDSLLRVSDVGVRDTLFGADVLVYACDSDVRGVGIFRRFLQTQMGIDYDHVPFPFLFVRDEAPKTLFSAFREGRTTRDPDFAAAVRKSEAKQFFDHNWALNALPLFGDALRSVGAEGDGFVSKYQMLLLHALRHAGPKSEVNIVTMMRDWQGSGKRRAVSAPVGCHASRDAIMRGLVRKGLIGPGPWMKTPHGSRRLLGITATGDAFLARTHPDCYDPDIAFRVREWQEAWPESRPAMERYIRTYFGKQKRFAAKHRP